MDTFFDQLEKSINSKYKEGGGELELTRKENGIIKCISHARTDNKQHLNEIRDPQRPQEKSRCDCQHREEKIIKVLVFMSTHKCENVLGYRVVDHFLSFL